MHGQQDIKKKLHTNNFEKTKQYPTIPSLTLVVKDAGKVFTMHIIKVYTVSRGTTLPIINFGTRWR
jgi:hypothetical protein